MSTNLGIREFWSRSMFPSCISLWQNVTGCFCCITIDLKIEIRKSKSLACVMSSLQSPSTLTYLSQSISSSKFMHFIALTFSNCRLSMSSLLSRMSIAVLSQLFIVSHIHVGSLLIGICIVCICPIFSAISRLKVESASSFVSKGRAGMYSSIRPPGNTPCSLGPSFLSDNKVKMTDSVMSPSKALSPCTCP